MTFLHIIVPCLTEAFSATSIYRMHRIRHNLHDGHSKHDIYAILIIIYQQLTNIELCVCVRKTGSWETQERATSRFSFFTLDFFIGMSQDLLTNIIRDYHHCSESVKAKLISLKFFINSKFKKKVLNTGLGTQWSYFFILIISKK